jgi:uncharacterized protein
VDSILAACLGIAFIGGLVRGTTGFGASMVMVPPLAYLLGPRTAVPVSLLLETFAAAPMLRAAFAQVRWRLMGPLCGAAILAVPLGAQVLAAASALTLRRAISVIVIVFALALLSGRRYRGAPRLGTSLALGALSGVLLGATSIGAPPVILYLLSGPDPVAVSRANLTVFVIVLSAVGLVMLGVSGLLTQATLMRAAWLALPFAGGVVAGSQLFARLSDERFRRVVMVFMLIVAFAMLFA